jgi:hypothetical protein
MKQRLLVGAVGLLVVVLLAAVVGCSGGKAVDKPPTTGADKPSSTEPTPSTDSAPPIDPVPGDSSASGAVEDDVSVSLSSTRQVGRCS